MTISSFYFLFYTVQYQTKAVMTEELARVINERGHMTLDKYPKQGKKYKTVIDWYLLLNCNVKRGGLDYSLIDQLNIQKH